MTDETLGDETPETDNPEAAFDLDAWLDGATLAQASVDILQRPDLLARYDEWTRRYERAEQIAKASPDAGLDDESPLAALDAEGESLLAEIAASRATWYVRSLQGSDIEAIEKAHPLPEKPALFEKDPPTPVHSPTEAQAKAYFKSMEAWGILRDRFNAEHKAEHEVWSTAAKAALVARGAEKVVRALDRIEVAGRAIATSITVEQVVSLGEKIGDMQVQKIIDAIDAAGSVEPEVPAAFLSRTSATDPE